MEYLAAALERFNRKERNLLTRKVLGHTSSHTIPVAEPFRREVAKAIGWPEGKIIPEDA